MNLLVGVLALTLSTGVLSAWPSHPHGLPDPSLARFAGTWRMAATRQTMADGSVRPDPDLGAHPVGYLMLDAVTRHMCAVVSNGDRPRWSDPAHPTAAEAQGIWNQTVAYCGSWSVDTARGELVYQMAINHSPNLVGAERRRRFKFSGEKLILYPMPLPPGVTEWEVEWQRAVAVPRTKKTGDRRSERPRQ